MPLIKGKDRPEVRRICGSVTKKYHVAPDNDLLCFSVLKRTLDAEEKFSMQLHSHPDFDEYWFVTGGKGQAIVGDETYDIEPEDLVIIPRGVPHKVIGDVTLAYCITRCNSKGLRKDKLQYLADDEPYRDEADRADMLKKGQFKEIDLSATD